MNEALSLVVIALVVADTWASNTPAAFHGMFLLGITGLLIVRPRRGN